MDKKDVAKIVVPAVAGFFVGDWFCTVRVNHKVNRLKRQKRKAAVDTDILKAMTNWMNDPTDNRVLGDVVDEWFYNNRFKKITNEM